MSTNTNDLPERAILLPFIIDYLRKYWLSNGKNDLGTSYKNGVLSEGQSIRTLARIPPEINSIVTDKINTLKADTGVMSTLNGNLAKQGLRSRRTDLILAGEKLANFIDENIIYKIQIGDYTTVCDKCPTNNNISHLTCLQPIINPTTAGRSVKLLIMYMR